MQKESGSSKDFSYSDHEWTNYGPLHHHEQPLPEYMPSCPRAWQVADVVDLNWSTHGHHKGNPQKIRTHAKNVNHPTKGGIQSCPNPS